MNIIDRIKKDHISLRGIIYEIEGLINKEKHPGASRLILRFLRTLGALRMRWWVKEGSASREYYPRMLQLTYYNLQ